MDTAKTIEYLHPTLKFWTDYEVRNDWKQWDLDYIVWENQQITQPTQAELISSRNTLEDIRIKNEYKVLRKAEYPEWTDFADAWVKNDQVAMDKYRADCLAVKVKFPKPM